MEADKTDPLVLKVHTKDVDEVGVVATATLTVTVGLLEGEKSISSQIDEISNKNSESAKQEGHGWGANEGGAELADEQAGAAMASAEHKDALTGDAAAADAIAAEPAVEAEPEDNSISYADYLAQQAEKLVKVLDSKN